MKSVKATKTVLSMMPILCLTVVSATSTAALADDAAPQGPLYQDGYAALLGSYLWGDGERLDEATGGTLLLGKRNGRTALEIGGFVFDYPESSKSFGGHIGGLYFPVDSLPNTFGAFGMGMQEIEDYPTTETGTLAGRDDLNMSMLFVQAGVGQLWPITLGRYQLSLRTDVMYRMSKRDKVQRENREDIDAPRRFDEIVANVGVQLPFGLLPPPEPVAATASVVEPVAAPDTDGDGVDDALDRCPDSSLGESVDATGCLPPPPEPTCNSSPGGSGVSLAGCGVGDVIVLRGVNFEFDRSKLTVNAESILEQVAGELVAHPGVSVEIAGHTDARGAEAYNQKLSQQRGEAVRRYLVSMGVAADRMGVVGYGESQPISDNESEDGRELNRRVELKVVTSGNAAAPTADTEQLPPTEQPVDEAP